MKCKMSYLRSSGVFTRGDLVEHEHRGEALEGFRFTISLGPGEP